MLRMNVAGAASLWALGVGGKKPKTVFDYDIRCRCHPEGVVVLAAANWKDVAKRHQGAELINVLSERTLPAKQSSSEESAATHVSWPPRESVPPTSAKKRYVPIRRQPVRHGWRHRQASPYEVYETVAVVATLAIVAWWLGSPR